MDSDRETCNHSHVTTLAAKRRLSCDAVRVICRPRDRHPVMEESSKTLEIFRTSSNHLRFPLVCNTTREAATTSRLLGLPLQSRSWNNFNSTKTGPPLLCLRPSITRVPVQNLSNVQGRYSEGSFRPENNISIAEEGQRAT